MIDRALTLQAEIDATLFILGEMAADPGATSVIEAMIDQASGFDAAKRDAAIDMLSQLRGRLEEWETVTGDSVGDMIEATRRAIARIGDAVE